MNQGFEYYLLGRLDHIQRTLDQSRGLLKKIDKQTMKTPPNIKGKPAWLTPHLIIWIVISSMALLGHITFDEAKMYLSKLRP